MTNIKGRMLSLSAFFVSVYVLTAFLLHLITYAFNGVVYCAILALSILAVGLTRPINWHTVPGRYMMSWILALGVLWFNCILRYRTNSVLIDAIVMTIGLLLIIMFSRKSRDYDATMSVISFMAVLFAFGVYLERFLPGVFRIVTRLLPAEMLSVMSSEKASTIGTAGFTTNVGFTANYIIVGLFVFFSRFNTNLRKRNISALKIVFLAIALLFTGKRGPVLFLVLSFIITTFAPAKKTGKMKRILLYVLLVVIILVTVTAFGDILEKIPVFGRYMATIDAFINGEDASSGRTNLHRWAWTLFLRNPVFGIGWGKYRTTVVGNATLVTELDAHNVYLQLLSETGAVGFLLFLVLFVASWVMIKNEYCECIYSQNTELIKWKPSLFFSFIFQTFFLLYCLSGNPLYDQFYQILYAFSCSIMIAYRYISGREKKGMVV